MTGSRSALNPYKPSTYDRLPLWTLTGASYALDRLSVCRDRKRAAELLLSRASQLEPDESELLKKAAAIETRRRAEAAARKPVSRVPCVLMTLIP